MSLMFVVTSITWLFVICEKFKIGYAKQADELKSEIERLSDEISCLDRKRKQRLEIKSAADERMIPDE